MISNSSTERGGTAPGPGFSMDPKWREHYRVLSLDGGGSKGMYTLGVLTALEEAMGARVTERFDLVYGVSTGSIIASLLVMGKTAKEVKALYKALIPEVMSKKSAAKRTAALRTILGRELKGVQPESLETRLTVVCYRLDENRPMVFKYDPNQLQSNRDSYVPGFGVPLSSVVLASCSARPYFTATTVRAQTFDPSAKKLVTRPVTLMDGGFSTSNPALFAALDTSLSLRWPIARTRMLSVGTGQFNFKAPVKYKIAVRTPGVKTLIELLEKTLEGNANATEEMRAFSHRDMASVRINGDFRNEDFKTSLLESDAGKLEDMYYFGRESFEASRDRVLNVLKF